MKKVIALFFLAAFVQAQTEYSKQSDIVVCEIVSHYGFAIVNEQSFAEAYDYLKDSTFSKLPFAVDVNGTVDSVFESYNFVQNPNNVRTSIPIIGITDHKTTAAKAISLKNHKLTLSGKDSTMERRFKPSLVFVPKNLPVNAGDVIAIRNYVALLNDTCYAGETSQQKALVYGEYAINQTTSIKGKKISNKATAISTRNRDANGKYSKKTSKYSVRF